MDRERELKEMEREWKAPRELMHSTPRDVRLARGGVAITVIACLLMAGGVAVAAFLSPVAQKQTADRKLLEAQGQITIATITRVYRSGGKENEPRVTYEFAYNGGIYHRSTRAPRSVWDRLSKGDKVSVRFLPTDPANNTPASWEGTEPLPPAVPIAMALGLAMLSLLMMFLIRRDRRLLADGSVAMGAITKRRRGQHARQYAYYEFRLKGGGTMKGRSEISRKYTADTITVIYNPENPKRNSAYPMNTVKIDQGL